jgi:hypothetical protein
MRTNLERPRYFSRAISAQPTNALAHFNLGSVLRKWEMSMRLANTSARPFDPIELSRCTAQSCLRLRKLDAFAKRGSGGKYRNGPRRSLGNRPAEAFFLHTKQYRPATSDLRHI